jgi:peptidoglycan hydrolase-like protein with peptidoglycan-binding domain
MPKTDPAVSAPTTVPESTSSSSGPTTSTTAEATTTTTVPADGRLLPGMQGEPVRALQERLVTLHYDPGAADGRYGGGLTSAVMAFQKVTGMPRNGRATVDVLAAIAAATDPAPMLPDGGATRIEVDFKRQVLFFWKDGALLRIVPVSTGNGKKYCEEGICGVAVTPSGSFRIERRIKGKRKSYLAFGPGLSRLPRLRTDPSARLALDVQRGPQPHTRLPDRRKASGHALAPGPAGRPAATRRSPADRRPGTGGGAASRRPSEG